VTPHHGDETRSGISRARPSPIPLPTLRQALEIELRRLEAAGRGASEINIGVGGCIYIPGCYDDPDQHVYTMLAGEHRWCDVIADELGLDVYDFQRHAIPALGIVRFWRLDEDDKTLREEKSLQQWQAEEVDDAGRGHHRHMVAAKPRPIGGM